MPQRVLDSRTRDGVYATKGNIDPPETAAGGVRATGPGVLGTDAVESDFDASINDAATGASSVITDDTTGQTADSGALPAGTYEVYFKVRHPSTAAANRSVVLEHRNAANNATNRILRTILADGPVGETRTGVIRGVVLAAGERIRAITGSDATNALISVYLGVTKVD